ncbi:MAG: biotin/lipoyl-containing protein, partial [Rhodoferax sp.]
MASIEIQVPDIGDFAEVTVIELMVKVGDTVKAEQSLITVESDKASMEIPSSHGGVITEIKVKLGDKVKQGSIVVLLEGSEQNQAVALAAAAPAATVSVAPAAAAPAAASSSGPVEVRIPDIGDFKDVSVIELLVKVGDTIKVEQSLITVESDKASMEIPSSTAGVVKEIKVKLGDTVNIGDLVVILEGVVGAAAASVAPATATAVAAAPTPVRAEPVEAPATSPSTGSGRTEVVPAHVPGAASLGLPHASPSVRKFARELGVPLNEVK